MTQNKSNDTKQKQSLKTFWSFPLKQKQWHKIEPTTKQKQCHITEAKSQNRSKASIFWLLHEEAIIDWSNNTKQKQRHKTEAMTLNRSSDTKKNVHVHEETIIRNHARKVYCKSICIEYLPEYLYRVSRYFFSRASVSRYFFRVSRHTMVKCNKPLLYWINKSCLSPNPVSQAELFNDFKVLFGSTVKLNTSGSLETCLIGRFVQRLVFRAGCT